ncbi:MAG: sulfurtransferase TusA family protein [Rhodocyclaceae bacterium]|nr:sulfurtransferase TusA family protein [Rhodocyclaceae bacterium]
MPTPIDLRLDVSGVCCPVPLIELAKSVRNLDAGQTLLITGNDPIFESSVRDFCLANGHAVVDVVAGARRSVSVLIRVGG